MNSRIAIQLDFNLVDTINHRDTIRVQFPSVCNFSFIDIRSGTSGFFINSTLTTYDSANKVLEIRQRNQAQINFAGRNISLLMSLFTVAPSIKPFMINV